MIKRIVIRDSNGGSVVREFAVKNEDVNVVQLCRMAAKKFLATNKQALVFTWDDFFEKVPRDLCRDMGFVPVGGAHTIQEVDANMLFE